MRTTLKPSPRGDSLTIFSARARARLNAVLSSIRASMLNEPSTTTIL
jgi:hypothetical protein